MASAARYRPAEALTRQTAFPTSSADEQGACPIERNADRTSAPPSSVSPARKSVTTGMGSTTRLSVNEGDEDHLVAVQRVPVPAAMLAHKGAAGELGGESVSPWLKVTPSAADMGAEAVIRLDRLRDHFRLLRMDALVHVLAPVAVRPAVEAALFYRRKVVGDEVRTDLVALVDDGEQLAGSWLKSRDLSDCAFRSRKSASPLSDDRPRRWPHDPPSTAKPFSVNVAVGTDPDIERGHRQGSQPATWSSDGRLGPREGR